MKISIVTPSFNQGQFIERTLQSVAEQRADLPKGVTLEHVVFDGGSTDNTVAVLCAFRPEVRFVSEKDKGQTDAINKGLRATDGEIIGWLNSDDVYYPHAVAHAVAFFQENKDVDVVYGQADHIDALDQPFESYPSEPWSFERLQEQCFLCQPAVFFRRSVVEQYGFLDESLHYCMDYAYWLRLGKLGARFAYVEEKWAGSRMYADNKTLGARVAVHRETNDMLQNMFGFVSDRWLITYAYVYVESRVNREKRPVWFALCLFFSVCCAARHWNQQVWPTIRSVLMRRGKSLFVSKSPLLDC